jgi:transposase-like protein
MNQKPQRRKFTEEFKKNAVQLVLDNRTTGRDLLFNVSRDS